MSNFCTVYGLRVFKFLEDFLIKKLKSKFCLLPWNYLLGLKIITITLLRDPTAEF
jgi:hypothetical protein